MKYIILTFSVTILSFVTFSQGGVAINNAGAAPNPNSMLDVTSDDKGVLITRLSTAARTTLGGALGVGDNGMLVYDKDLLVFYYWDGTQWVLVGNGVGSDDQNLTGATLTGTTLQIDIEDGTSATVDLSSLQDGVTDPDADITNEIQDLTYDPATSILSLSDDATTVDLTTLKDHDWYEVGGVINADAITDDIFTQGNVGIGLISPTQKLHVLDGNVYVSMNSGLGSGTLGSGGIELYRDPSGTVPDVNGFIDFKDDEADDSDFRIFYNNTIGTNGALVFSGGINGLPNGVPKLLIRNQDGNVGINTAAPTNKLDIDGDLRVRTISPGTSSNEVLVVDGTGVVKKVTALVPPGMVNAYAGAIAPAGYLICNGTAVSRVTYAELFTVIGITYGVGDGTTTFNLPDLRGEFIRGLDAGRGADPTRVLGSNQIASPVVGDDNNAPNDFSMQVQGYTPQFFDNYNNAYSAIYFYYSAATSTYQIQPSNGGGFLKGSRPRNVAMNYCIKF